MTLRPTIDAAFESGRTQLDLAALGLPSFVERADRFAAGV